jgi:hypothetical protein
MAVGAGDRVPAGAPLATAGADGVVRLGARRAPGGYVDPATLFRRAPPPLGPAPSPRAIRRTPWPRAAPRADPVAAPPGAPPATPPLAWLGAALLALAVPGRLLRARRGRALKPALSRPSSATRWSR